MRGPFEQGRASHELHGLDLPVPFAELACMRAASHNWTMAVSDAEFEHVTSFFVAPQPSEGFKVIRAPRRRAEDGMKRRFSVDHTSSHSLRTAESAIRSAGAPSKTTRPCPIT